LVLDVQLQEVGSVYLDQAVDAIKNERAQALRRYNTFALLSQLWWTQVFADLNLRAPDG